MKATYESEINTWKQNFSNWNSFLASTSCFF